MPKVKDCHNTNSIFDNRKYVLLKDYNDLLAKYQALKDAYDKLVHLKLRKIKV